MNEVDPIEKTMNELVFLLKYNGERHWSSMFEKLLEEYHNATLKKVAIKKILDVYKGGMGYFNDLVLLRNYVIPIGFSLRETVGEQEYLILKNENEKLADLSERLYQDCIDYEKNSCEYEISNVCPLHRQG